jgi:hypothetical protein
MKTHLEGCGVPSATLKDGLVGAGLTIGSALVLAAIMLIGRNSVTESIGTVMFPGVLAVGVQWMYVRERSRLVKIVFIGGPFVILFLIGLLAGLAQSS